MEEREQRQESGQEQKESFLDEEMRSGSYERTVIVKKKKGIPAENARRRPKKGILIWLGIILIMVGVTAVISSSGWSEGLPSGPYIAVLNIQGEISSNSDLTFSTESYHHQWTLDQIDQMEEDSDNQGILLFLDTPGGGVYESDELYLKLMEYKEYTGRPVYAAMGSLAASGGYYAAMASDQIYANRNTLTGSIGVMMSTQYDISGFLERYGIRTQQLVSGRNKGMGSPTQPLTAEQLSIYQSIIDESYEQFAAIVAEGRNLSIDQVKVLADGRLYTAKQALEAGLVDEIGTEEDAAAAMIGEYGLEDCDVVELAYEESSIWDRLAVKIGRLGVKADGDAAALLKYVQGESRHPISYLCEFPS